MSELSVGSLSGLAANSYVIDVASGSTLDLSAGAVLPAGSILQVVSTTKTDSFSASLATEAETAITGLTATITPSSTSSKILIFASITTTGSSGSNSTSCTLFRDATAIGLADAASNRQRTGGGSTGAAAGGEFSESINSISLSFQDAPASSSSITYSVKIRHARSATQTVYVNRSISDPDNATQSRGVSTITVMEVAG